MDPDLVMALITSELISRRSDAVDPDERRRLSIRSLALASVGAPPVVAVIDTQNQVSAIERAAVRPSGVTPGTGFQEVGRRIARDLAMAAAAAEDQISRSEERIKEATAALKEQKEALEETKQQAEQLEGCAEAVGAVFESG